MTYSQAVEHLKTRFGDSISDQSGVLTLKNANQEECLVLQSEDGGERVSLFAPFLESVSNLNLCKSLNLHLLHLNSDLDSLGSLRIMFNPDSKRYLLCDANISSASHEEFIEYLNQVLALAKYLHAELADGLLGADGAAAEVGSISSEYLKA